MARLRGDLGRGPRRTDHGVSTGPRRPDERRRGNGWTARHAGHADIVRETLDRTAGMAPGDGMVTRRTPEEWVTHRSRIEAAARATFIGAG